MTLRVFSEIGLNPNFIEQLKKELKTDENTPIDLKTIVELAGFDFALYCCYALPDKCHSILREFAIWCVKQIRDLIPKEKLYLIDVAERYYDGKISEEEIEQIRYIAALSLSTKDISAKHAASAVWNLIYDNAVASAIFTSEEAAFAYAWVGGSWKDERYNEMRDKQKDKFLSLIGEYDD